MAGISFESGYRSDTVVLKLNPPQVVTKDQILTSDAVIQLKHQIAGTVIRYTLDDTEPDSITSLVYKNGVKIKDNTRLQARAFKPGWYGSNVVKRYFYRNTFRPDSVLLLTKPAPQYNGTNGKVLADGVKSTGDFKNGKWTGFMDEPLTALLSYKNPVTAQKISLSMLPVSYTHLDVYKRQALYRARSSAPIRESSGLRPRSDDGRCPFRTWPVAGRRRY